MKYFIELGISVYALHDCDIAGYLIADKLLHGSDTFPYSLPITDLGLTVADAQELDKIPEKQKPKQGYSHCLNSFEPEVRAFFDAGRGYYRRVELNALTNDELIEFIRDRIKPVRIEIDTKRLERYALFDRAAMVKDALYFALDDDMKEQLLEKATIDKEVLLERIQARNGEHWTQALIYEQSRASNDKVLELIDAMENWR